MQETEKQSIAYISVVHPLHDHRFIYKECKCLVDGGFKVDYYVQADCKQTINGVQVLPLSVPKSRLRRFLSTFLLLKRIGAAKYDAVHLVDPELLPLGILLKWLTCRAVVFDAHEDYVDFMAHKHYIPKWVVGFISAGMSFLLNYASRALDGFVFADYATADRFINMPAEKKGYFFNFPVLSMFPENPVPWCQRQYDLVYLGTMSKTSGLFVLLETIALLVKKRPNIKCLFIGQPHDSLREETQKLIEKNNIGSNVVFSGRVPHAQVPKLLQNCKIGLIGLLDLPKFHRNIATKMFEYFASGIPVVSSDLPPERIFMTDGLHGYFVKPGNAHAYADASDKILSDETLADKMSRACREHLCSQGYYSEKEMEKFIRYYEKLLAAGRR
jgi:glycosyltransferase involved in cell wall biosynthesis